MKRVAKKENKKDKFSQGVYSSNPISSRVIQPKAFVRKAVDLYEKQADIKKFAKLVVQESITEEFLCNIQAELLLKDVFNPFCDESYRHLAENEQLLKDLTSDTDIGT